MKEQFLLAWQINQQMNLLLFDHITDVGMQKSLSTRGGRTVGQQWIHLHQVRAGWLEVCAKDLFTKIEKVDKAAAFNRKKLRRALESSGKAVSVFFNRSWDEEGKVKSFKTGLIPFADYLIAHEAHHRGNMLLTLKQTGEKIPDNVKWGLWEWGK